MTTEQGALVATIDRLNAERARITAERDRARDLAARLDALTAWHVVPRLRAERPMRHGPRRWTRRRLMDLRVPFADHAACGGHDEPEMWHPVGRDQADPAALSICRHRCTVRRECLQWALDHDESGIWGGLTDAQRGSIRAERKRERRQEARRQEQIAQAARWAAMFASGMTRDEIAHVDGSSRSVVSRRLAMAREAAS